MPTTDSEKARRRSLQMLRCTDEADGNIRDGFGAEDSLMPEALGDDQLGVRPRAGDALPGAHGDFLVVSVVDDEKRDLH